MAVEMNKKQRELFDKLKPLQKEICINSLSGMNDIDAYRNSKGKAKSESAQRAGVCEILANPNVKAFMSAMKEEAVERALVTVEDVVNGLLTEAQFNGEGSSQSARVSAWKALTDYTGGFNNNVQKVETKSTAVDDSELSW